MDTPYLLIVWVMLCCTCRVLPWWPGSSGRTLQLVVTAGCNLLQGAQAVALLCTAEHGTSSETVLKCPSYKPTTSKPTMSPSKCLPGTDLVGTCAGIAWMDSQYSTQKGFLRSLPRMLHVLLYRGGSELVRPAGKLLCSKLHVSHTCWS